MSEHDVPLRVLYDDKGVSTRAYQAPATSFVVIVDSSGTVTYTGVGARPGVRACAPPGHRRRELRYFMRKSSLLLGCVVSPTSRPGRAGRRAGFGLPRVGPLPGRSGAGFLASVGRRRTGSGTSSGSASPHSAGRLLVLAFYPADFTKGCTAEMQTFTERYDELFGSDVVVAAISHDSVETPRTLRLEPGRSLQAAERSGPRCREEVRQRRLRWESPAVACS